MGINVSYYYNYSYYYYYYAFGTCAEYTGGRSFLAETWEWDGTTWNNLGLAAGQSPPARGGHAMTYAADRQRVVLFGGMTSNGPVDDTWEWDGTSWALGTPSLAPGGRWGHAMTFDAARQRVLLYAGTTSDAIPIYYYFSSGTSPLNDTWAYGDTIAAVSQTYGSGCAGPGVTSPGLGVHGRPFLGNSAFSLGIGSAPPFAPVSLALSGGIGAIPLGSGCSLWIAPSTFVVALAGQADGYGLVRFGLQIPSDETLLGLELASQGVVMDPTGPLGGISLTNGLRFTIGE